MGCRGNRGFNYIPFTKLYTYLSYLCQRSGINYIETEESYTSQASFFGRDEIPAYDKEKLGVYKFSGSRTDRDTYVNADGTVVHADINGALNIMRKVLPELCGDIKVRNVTGYDVLKHETFFPQYVHKKKAA